MLTTIEWFAAITGMIAALMIAWNHSAKVSGWGFVVFCVGSVSWITAGIIDGNSALTVQNVVFLGINAIGIYRYLIRKDEVA